MTDRDFFYKTLGQSKPWEIKDVRLDLGGRRVELEIGVKAGTTWGQDGLMLPIEGYEERMWRHLDTMQLEMVLRARVPRVRQPRLVNVARKRTLFTTSSMSLRCWDRRWT